MRNLETLSVHGRRCPSGRRWWRSDAYSPKAVEKLQSMCFWANVTIPRQATTQCYWKPTSAQRSTSIFAACGKVSEKRRRRVVHRLATLEILLVYQ